MNGFLNRLFTIKNSFIVSSTFNHVEINPNDIDSLVEFIGIYNSFLNPWRWILYNIERKFFPPIFVRNIPYYG